MSQSDFVTRGQSLVAAGQFQEAVKVCRLGLLGRPTTVEGRVVLGQALLALKRYDEVLAEMRVALELDHVSLAAQLLKGEALLRKGDAAAAADILVRVRAQAPSDPRANELLAEAERMSGRGGGNQALGFIGGDTRNYPNHARSDLMDEDGPGNYTRPTSLSAPVAKKRSNKQQAIAGDATPPPAVLAVGDRSGTVEVDPGADGVEVDDEDLGALASPPVSPAPIIVGSPRAKRPSQAEVIAARRPRARKEVSSVSSVELEPDDLVEVGSHDDDDDGDASETRSAAKPYTGLPGPGTAVRNAVQVAPGPLSGSMRAQAPPAARPTAIGQAVPPLFPPQPPLAHQLAAQPMMHAPPAPLPPPPSRPIAAAMPTMAAMPPPPMIPPGSPSSTFRASPPPPHYPPPGQPAYGLSPMQQESAALVDQMFSAEQPPPAWARNTVMAGPGIPPLNPSMEPTARAMPINPSDPNISGYPVDVPMPMGPMGPSSQPEMSSGGGKLKTGMRKRSRLQIAVWVTIGALVIGGGVFAGFQIRAMRLGKQITAARDQATEQAKADTWQGWLGARENLSRIMSASATSDNKAALARVRGLLAFEFGDGLPEAKSAVDGLAGDTSTDAQIAEAYVALAANDTKAAKSAADLAIGNAPGDPAAHYVVGQAELLAGDTKDAVTSLKTAADAEPRPLYLLGLARALAASGSIDDALGAVDKALQASPDNPAAAITRAFMLASAGRLGTTSVANDVHAQLERLVGEGAKPIADQPHGVSPAQLAFADLALAQVDYARGKVPEAIADVNRAAQIQFDDQRFAEAAVDTLYRLSRLDNARSAGDNALKQFPSSRRVKTTLASILLAQGKPNDALELIAKTADLVQDPAAQVVRGQARVATGDLDGARADFESALKKAPNLESAIVGRAWLDLTAGQLDDAKKAIDKRYKEATASPALATVYAAIVRAGGDQAKARAILEKVVAGPPSVDMPRAQLEMARTYRDSGEPRLARGAYAEASKAGLLDARLESGLLQIEERDPNGGRDTIDQLLKELGDKAPSNVVLEGARARMLVGDHGGAKALLETASKQTGVLKWQLAREKGRLALRQGDYTGAAQELSRALDACEDDADTFILASEAVDGDAKLVPLAEKLRALAPKRLAHKAEANVVAGLFALTDLGDGTEAAQQAYEKAKEQLSAEKASQRRQARAHFGLAIIAISRKDAPSAANELDAALVNDPSLYNAYLYEAQLLADKKPQVALDNANKAVTFNPDSLDGWMTVGVLASRLNDGKRLAEAISRLGEIGPTTEQFKTVNALRRR